MSQRITQCFARLKAEDKSAFIPFIMGGDPDIEKSTALLLALPDAGADIIELGIPFSDPMADGPTIQAAGKRALEHDTCLRDVLEMARQFRLRHPQVPLVLMGYYNPIYQYGLAQFAWDAQKIGVDGLIIVDLPPEESDELTVHLKSTDIALIRLIAPPSLATRLPMLTTDASGYLYYVSMTGVTGSKTIDLAALQQDILKIRHATSLPVAVGFGIKTAEHARAVAQVADGVIVGSAIVECVEKHKEKEAAALVQAVSEFIRALKP